MFKFARFGHQAPKVSSDDQELITFDAILTRLILSSVFPPGEVIVSKLFEAKCRFSSLIRTIRWRRGSNILNY